ncbi:MAG: amino acid racemase [Blastocatellia bacterium]
MDSKKHQGILGVLGGMGPLASAEFLKTIYESTLGEREQDAPAVFVYSDPTFPDRTDAFLSNNEGIVLDKLIAALESLRGLGASRIVICCMTIHHLLPKLSRDLRQPILSLLDVIFDSLTVERRKMLLICSNGTRKLKLFEGHEKWESVKDRIILPNEKDQQIIHKEIIYPIKKNPDLDGPMRLLKSLLDKYEATSFIAGCSEIHVLAKHFQQSSANGNRYDCLDPLAIIANDLAEDRL